MILQWTILCGNICIAKVEKLSTILEFTSFQDIVMFRKRINIKYRMIKLVKLEKKYKEQLFEMMDEWSNADEKIIPYAIRKIDYHNFDLYLENIEVKKETENSVPDSTFFALDTERNIFVGAVNIRHYLNKQLLQNGGHIGDGVRPSERRKGYATEMIRLALKECKKLGISKVLMVCYKDNIGSSKSIIKNGGILENEIPAEDGKIDQRYWITIK